MIIVGYQGIGKSTLAKGGNGFIDLESGNFWVDGKRDENWAQVYVNIARNLSAQGYHVFTSSHKAVRDCLREYPAVADCSGPMVRAIVAVCYPDLTLKDEWIAKLSSRYANTGLDKDYKAWKNAEAIYEENIRDLMNEKEPFIQIPIKSTDYSLEDVLARYSICKKGVGVCAV